MDFRLKHPCTGLIVGGTGAGKSFFTKRLIEHRADLFDTVFDDIIFCYSEWQPLYEALSEKESVEFRQELPSLEDLSPQDRGLSFSLLTILCMKSKNIKKKF